MICDTLETRQLITLGADGILVRCTYHDVPRKTTGSTSPDKRVGVLFLNPLSVPRSLLGDAAAYWASSFAAQGYPSLRIDLPGFGDSYGELPKDLLTFINNAGYAAIAAAKVKEFKERFGLAGVVIYGHCAGGTTAIYAASACKACKGLIITDPYFNTANMLTPKLSAGLVLWARRTKVGEVLRAAYARLRETRKKQDNSTLPSNANIKLVTHWKQLASSGLPILVCKSAEPAGALGSNKLRASMFDYLEHITSFAGDRSRLSLHTIEGTNHSFADRVGRAAVREHAEAWLHEHFAGGAAETSYFPETVASAQVQVALPFSSSTTNVDSLVFSPGCCNSDDLLPTAGNSRLEGLVSCNDKSSLPSTFFF